MRYEDTSQAGSSLSHRSSHADFSRLCIALVSVTRDSEDTPAKGTTNKHLPALDFGLSGQALRVV